jgi:Kef-type K+ transport system membrane component KefB
LLFSVGLESNVADVLRVGVAAARVAVIGSVATFALGWGVAALLLRGAPPSSHAFLGAAIAATSVGISARVLKDMGKGRTKEARTILGAAVLDDILALIVLSLVTGWALRATSGENGGTSLILTLGKTLAYLAVAIVLGSFLAPRVFALTSRLHTRSALVVVGLSFCFFFAWTADVAGLSPIVGAFVAGLVIEESHWAPFVARGERALDQEVEPLSALLVPLFFCLLGMRTDLSVFARPGTLLLALALTASAILGKLACGLGAERGTNRFAIALGMMPRGEVSLIFATVGLTAQGASGPIIDRGAQSALVVVVALTTLLTPTALKWSFSRATRVAHSLSGGLRVESGMRIVTVVP